MKNFLSAINLAFIFSTALADDSAFFESKIRPVLIEKCYPCHPADANKAKGGLQLDTREGIRRGGDTGPAIIPSDPVKSELLSAIRYEGLEMPPKGKLPDEVIADFEKWIESGAFDPRDGTSTTTNTIDIDAGRRHWSFQPLSKPPIPKVKDEAWPRTDIDRFVLAALEAKGLKPVADAEATTVQRRIAFDLTGLPPNEIAAPATHANARGKPREYQAIVEQYLNSPRFGERWGAIGSMSQDMLIRLAAVTMSCSR